MLTLIDKNYGADADGNRGTNVVEFVIEYSDRDSITEQVKKILEDYGVDDYPDTLWVTLYSDTYDDTVEFEVNISDYINKETQ